MTMLRSKLSKSQLGRFVKITVGNEAQIPDFVKFSNLALLQVYDIVFSFCPFV